MSISTVNVVFLLLHRSIPTSTLRWICHLINDFSQAAFLNSKLNTAERFFKYLLNIFSLILVLLCYNHHGGNRHTQAHSVTTPISSLRFPYFYIQTLLPCSSFRLLIQKENNMPIGKWEIVLKVQKEKKDALVPSRVRIHPESKVSAETLVR